MILSVDSIAKMGGYTGGPVRKKITWQQGNDNLEADIFVRPMSYHTAITDLLPGQTKEMIVANRLCSCICDEGGAPVFRLQDITGIDEDGQPVKIKNDKGEMVERGALCTALSNALMGAVGEVSGLGKKKPKKS